MDAQPQLFTMPEQKSISHEARLTRERIELELRAPIRSAKETARSKAASDEGNLFMGGLTPKMI